MPFEAALLRMRELHQAVRNGADGRVLLCEHDPVFTAGRATPSEELPPSVVPIERGGKVTYHGPGQLVVYPIVPLPRRDVRDWLRRLERFGVDVAAAFALVGEPSLDGTGVFVAGRKVASIGIAVKHWINLHGIAINVQVANEAWAPIRPCGRSPTSMSDLSTCAGRVVTMAEARTAAAAAVSRLLHPADPV